MKISKYFFPITTLGPRNRLVIWTIGCPHNCRGCSNPELQSIDQGEDLNFRDILSDFDISLIEGVTITGGEPFLNIKDLKEAVKVLVELGVTDILVYTGFKFEDLNSRIDPDIEYIFSNIAVLIDGLFEIDLVDDLPLRGSANQDIIFLKKEFYNLYNEYLKEEKNIEIIKLDNGEVHFIGIPPKNYDSLYKDYLKITNNGYKL